MFHQAALVALSLLCTATAQQVGKFTVESHPSLTSQKCTTAGGCVDEATTIVLDQNWRWVHSAAGSNCYTGNTWDATLCPDPTACASACALEGLGTNDYKNTYGITTSANSLTLGFVTGANIGSRVYLMDSATNYKMFDLLNQEFTFDVDVSNLPCGLNGALYFSQMSADGGLAKYAGNKAGAAYGTGYCDAQCPQDIKFINGAANTNKWTPSVNNKNTGTGQFGSCCPEMDIWEANSVSNAYTPHPCSVDGQTQCNGLDCGGGADRYKGVCDKDGCDYNPYRMGNQSFFGAGSLVDTTKPFTVVTQFVTTDGTATGALSEIKRVYVQNGVVIQNSKVDVAGVDAGNSITDKFCAQQKSVFGDPATFTTKGGLAQMGKAFGTGMVLVMSLWDDYSANQLWLDSTYPPTADVTKAGVARGKCDPSSGVPADVESKFPQSSVSFSNIRSGDIGSTVKGVS